MQQITIEHRVVTSNKSYEQVIERLEERLGQQADWAALQQVIQTNGTFEQAIQLIEQQLGTSGFTLFSKINPGALLTMSGTPTRTTQYALGNPLLAIQMIEHAPEAALYAPLRLAVYENRAGNAVITYEGFASQLAQYPSPEIAPVAHLVEQKLEAMVAEVTGNGQQISSDNGGDFEEKRRNAMTIIDVLVERNQDFASHHFSKSVSLMPTLKTMIISCVDPRVDPALLLGLKLGEAVVIRNIGGRITPGTLQTIGMLGRIAQSEGANPGGEFHLIVLHHTQCGIARLEGNPDMLASYFGIGKEELGIKAVTDPYAAVAVDVAALKVNPTLPGTWLVSGLVYDVTTGLVEVVVPPAPLRHR